MSRFALLWTNSSHHRAINHRQKPQTVSQNKRFLLINFSFQAFYYSNRNLASTPPMAGGAWTPDLGADIRFQPSPRIQAQKQLKSSLSPQHDLEATQCPLSPIRLCFSCSAFLSIWEYSIFLLRTCGDEYFFFQTGGEWVKVRQLINEQKVSLSLRGAQDWWAIVGEKTWGAWEESNQCQAIWDTKPV